MLDKIKEFFAYASEQGLRLPAAYDADKKGPSATLFFAHVAFYLASVSIIMLIASDLKQGVIAATMFSAVYTIFYLIRRLNKASVDVKDGTFNLENDEKEKE